MEKKEIRNLLRPKGEYAKGDIAHYTELGAGKIRAALLTKSAEQIMPLFDLIIDKDTTVGDESDKRAASVENKHFTHALDEHYEESLEELIKASLHAKLFGTSVVELYLDEEAQFAFRFIDREYYYFKEGEVWLKRGKKPFKVQAPKFYVIKSKPVLLRVLWIVYAKHYVLSHYLKFTEFLGVPPLIGHASSSDDDVIDAMATAFDNLKSGSYAVLGKDDVVKILEGKGTQSDFMEFVRYADEQISKSISGSVLSGTATKAGTQALGTIHEKNRYEIIAGDVKFAKVNVRVLFKIIGLTPDLNIQIEQDVDLYKRAHTLKILQDLGYTITSEQIAKEFDLPLPEAKEINNVLQRNAKSSTLPKDKTDKFLGSSAFKGQLQANEIEIKKEIAELLLNAESFEEAFDALVSAYPDVSFEELEDTFTKVLFNAEIFGNEEEL